MIMQNEHVVPVLAYSQEQAAKIMSLRDSSWRRFLALDEIPIRFTVHSKHDWQLKGDNTYDLVIDARPDFEVHFRLQDIAS